MVLLRHAANGPYVPADHLSGTRFRETVHTPTRRTASSGRQPVLMSVQVQVTKAELQFSFSRLHRMSYNDFLRHYSRVELCTLTPDTIEDDSVKHWSVSKFDGAWRRGSTAGGCRNNPCKFCF